MRTYAQEEEQSDEVESLVDNQALYEVGNDATMSQVVKEESEENDNRAQGTSSRPNVNDCQIVLGGQTFRCLPREIIVDRSEASEKKEKAPLKKLLRRGSRNRSVPTRYGTTYTHKSEKVDVFEPNTYREAVESSDKALWLVAMQQEMNAFAENETLVERPKDKNVINGKWVFKVKQNEEGETDKYKARYVAKGYAQVEGADFNETFAPTCRPETFRTVLAIAASRKVSIEQMDVKSAYLHSEIQEEIYLEQPEGFEKGNNLVCKLRKSINGLRQSARNWYKKLHDFLLEKEMTKCANDPCLFTSKSQENFLYILTWVDDLLIVGNKPEDVQKFEI